MGLRSSTISTADSVGRSERPPAIRSCFSISTSSAINHSLNKFPNLLHWPPVSLSQGDVGAFIFSKRAKHRAIAVPLLSTTSKRNEQQEHRTPEESGPEYLRLSLSP